MTNLIALRAGRVLAEGALRPGWWVTVSDGRIAAVGPRPEPEAGLLDLGEVDLLPGLVDLHSDCLEERAQPRPGSTLPLAAALLDLDAELAANGITTHYLCVAIMEEQAKRRSLDRAARTLETCARIRGELRVDHRVHLRVELTADLLDVVDRMAAADAVALVSYMDHTPGQGQFGDEAVWRSYYPQADHEEILARIRERQHQIAPGRQAVAAAAHGGDAVLASHDDDSAEAVSTAAALGARICEFPVTHEAAKAAHAAGLAVVMGAPNARRGSSHMANLSAREALAIGCLDGLASDYHPPSMLASAYQLADEGVCGLAEAVALVTSGPAAAADLDDRGVIAPGRRADLVAVGRRGGLPAVAQTFVAGRPVFGAVT